MIRRGAEELTLAPLDNRALANLCGPLDANLRQIEAALDVAISHRGPEFTIEGMPPQTARAAEVLQRFYAGAEKPLHAFETLTLAPIDRRLVAPALMTGDEIAWLDAYHARVRAELSPLLDAESRDWLARAAAPLG